MRSFWVVVHRWCGLFIAVFLLVAGLTGAVISWDHELDEWLNRRLFDVQGRGSYLQPLDLAQRVEADDPRRRVIFLPLQFEPGKSAAISVTGRIDPATRRQLELGHNQVFVDPTTGSILGQREWGKAALDREHLLPFLYALHYSLHIPEMWGIDRWGIWLMGIVGMVWLFDCFVGLYLTFPGRRRSSHLPAAVVEPDDAEPAQAARSWWQRWRSAWTVKWQASSYRVNLDLHRAAGLWFWLLLGIVAFTSISMNLQYEVVRPVLDTVSRLTPDPFQSRAPASRHEPVEPTLGMQQAIEHASRDAQRRGWQESAGYVHYPPEFGIYAVGFFPAGHDPHGAGGMGVKTIYLDGLDGSVLGEKVPWKGTGGDIFLQLQFPLHSGRIAGIPGRVLMSAFGLVVAMLSLTGIVIWLKKRAGRSRARLRALSPAADHG